MSDRILLKLLTFFFPDAIQLNRYSNVAISEGMFIQEEYNSKTNSKRKFFKFNDGGPVNSAANFVWNDGIMIHGKCKIPR